MTRGEYLLRLIPARPVKFASRYLFIGLIMRISPFRRDVILPLSSTELEQNTWCELHLKLPYSPSFIEIDRWDFYKAVPDL